MRTALPFLVAALTAVSGPASAQMGFCEYGKTCTKVKVANDSSALVKAVNITQKTTDGACDYKKIKHGDNLSGLGGGQGGLEGQSFKIRMKTTCEYKIKYKTTSGCTGDKVAHITPTKFSAGKDAVSLSEACGTLKTNVFKE